MKELFTFLGQNAPYLLSVASSLFALRIAWDAYKSGVGVLGAVARGLGMIVTFAIVINVLPWMVEWGVNQSYSHYKTGSVSSNLLAIGKGAGDLLTSTDNKATVDLTVPEAGSVAEAAADLVENVLATNSETAAAAPAENVAPPAVEKPAAVAPAAVAPSRPGPSSYIAPTIADAVAPVAPLLNTDKPAQPVAPAVTELLAAPTQTANEYIDQFLKEQGSKPAEGGGPLTYTVKSGDSLATIAKAHNVDYRAIMAANAGIVRDWNIIRSGLVLVIP